MCYDRRNPLLNGYSFVITEDQSNNQYKLTVSDEIGRGGSCITYRGSVINYVDPEGLPVDAIIKEFYPCNLEEKGLYRKSEALYADTPDLKRSFDNQLAAFRKGQVKHIIFANSNPDKALPAVDHSGFANGTFYTVSKVAKGTTLEDAYKTNQVKTIVDALKIAASICDVIFAIHNNKTHSKNIYDKGVGQLYLDLKPSNVYYSDGNAYLFDFDSVCSFVNIEYCSRSEGWAAPEQEFNKAKTGYKDINKIGYHTDIYAIGMIMFWLLTGKSFYDMSLDELPENFDWKSQIVLKDTTSVTSDVDYIEELDRIMREMTCRDADERAVIFGDIGAARTAREKIKHLIKLSNKAFPDTIVEKPIFYVPSRNLSFIERNDVITQIESVLSKGGSPVILSGMGGVGKTQIAIEYAYSHKDEYNIIYWIDATNQRSMVDSCLLYINAFENTPDIKKKNAIQEFSRIFMQKNSWLLILDNADYLYEKSDEDTFNCKALKKFVSVGSGHIIITSRCNKKFSWGTSISVDVFTEEQALSFLVSKTKLMKDEYAIKLVSEAGYLPLALDYISSYIERQSIQYRNYLNLWKNHGPSLFDHEAYTEKTVRRAFHISIDKFDNRKDRMALELLYLLASLDVDYLPLETYIDWLKEEQKDEYNRLKDSLEFGIKPYVYLPDPKHINKYVRYIYFDKIDERYLKRRRAGHLKVEIVDTEQFEGLLKALNNELERNELIRKLQEYSLIKKDNEKVYIHPLLREIIVSELPTNSKYIWCNSKYLCNALALIYHKYGDIDNTCKYLYYSLKAEYKEIIDYIEEGKSEKEPLNRISYLEEISGSMYSLICLSTIGLRGLFKIVLGLGSKKYIIAINSFVRESFDTLLTTLEHHRLHDKEIIEWFGYDFVNEFIIPKLKEVEIVYYDFISYLLGTGVLYNSCFLTKNDKMVGKKFSVYFINAQDIDYCPSEWDCKCCIHTSFHNSVPFIFENIADIKENAKYLVDYWLPNEKEVGCQIRELIKNKGTDWSIIALPNGYDYTTAIDKIERVYNISRKEKFEADSHYRIETNKKIHHYFEISSGIGQAIIISLVKFGKSLFDYHYTFSYICADEFVLNDDMKDEISEWIEDSAKGKERLILLLNELKDIESYNKSQFEQYRVTNIKPNYKDISWNILAIPNGMDISDILLNAEDIKDIH